MFGRPRLRDLTAHEVHTLVEAGDIILVDVREPYEQCLGLMPALPGRCVQEAVPLGGLPDAFLSARPTREEPR